MAPKQEDAPKRPPAPWSRLSAEERFKRYKETTDPRANGWCYVGTQGITEINENTGRLRYCRAPGEDGKSPSPFALPDEELPYGLWLAGDSKEGVSPAERYRKAREVVRRRFQIQHFLETDTLPFRIRVAYRIVRELARIKGLVEDDETLGEGLQSSLQCKDPWEIPTSVRYPPSGSAAHNSAAAVTMEILDGSERLSERFRNPKGTGGLALEPPPALGPEDTYDPLEDVLLKRWCMALEEIGRYLRLEEGSEKCPELGALGFVDLVDPRTARRLWPSRLQILAWEEILLEQLSRLLIDHSPRRARRIMKERHGLTPWELAPLTKQAITAIRRDAELDVEERRALMTARLEAYCARARSALDLRAELAAIKQLSIIHGLGKTEPEDAISAFAGIVKAMDAQDTLGASQRPKLRG